MGYNCSNVPAAGAGNEEVQDKPWYFGPISRADCDVLMSEKGHDGDFLVRDSESTVSDELPLYNNDNYYLGWRLLRVSESSWT